MLKDLESVNKRLEKIPATLKRASNPLEKKALEAELALLEQIRPVLDKGDLKAVRALVAQNPTATIPLLTAKNFLIIANVAESELDGQAYKNNKHYQSLIAHFGAERVIPVSAKVEGELSQLAPEEAAEMMGMLGITEPSLDVIIRRTYENLGLITFFTCGPKEIHAWPIKKGTTIRKAAGEIHSDLERGFICAEVFNCADLFSLGSVVKVKEQGKFRTEGSEYIVKDGDIINVRFNV